MFMFDGVVYACDGVCFCINLSIFCAVQFASNVKILFGIHYMAIHKAVFIGTGKKNKKTGNTKEKMSLLPFTSVFLPASPH